ncbi:hypothetical protein E4U47_007371 [Claviceps purpurea]|nr:hypothetical protein E4U47_007371 [Claviceps purpurea]
MQIFNIIAITLATMATASPVNTDAVEEGVASVQLPAGCKKHDLACKIECAIELRRSACSMTKKTDRHGKPKIVCALHLVGTTAKCGSAIIEAGANPIADISCVASAAGLASSIDTCKHCIPKKLEAVEE